jgi:hypothetical protein
MTCPKEKGPTVLEQQRAKISQNQHPTFLKKGADTMKVPPFTSNINLENCRPQPRLSDLGDSADMIRDQFLNAGKTLTPLDGKRPITKNWVNSRPTMEQIKTHKGNFGWVLTVEDLVVDVDPRTAVT